MNREEYIVSTGKNGTIVRHNQLAMCEKKYYDEFYLRIVKNEARRFLAESLKAQTLGQPSYIFHFGTKYNADGGIVYDSGLLTTMQNDQIGMELGLKDFACKQITYSILQKPFGTNQWNYYLKIDVLF